MLLSSQALTICLTVWVRTRMATCPAGSLRMRAKLRKGCWHAVRKEGEQDSVLVLRKERVGRVTRVRVVEDLKLVLVVDNSSTSLSENSRSLAHNRLEHRLEGGEDEGVDLQEREESVEKGQEQKSRTNGVGHLLNEGRKTGDLLDGVLDTLDNLCTRRT
jgi:hypothetical protein